MVYYDPLALSNATGWQVRDYNTGAILGGGTFTDIAPAGGSSPFDPSGFYGAFGSTFGPAIGGASSAVPLTAGATAAKGGGNAPVAGNVGTAPATGTTVWNIGSVNDFFVRAILVVLGLVFIAAGLWMLKGNIIEMVRR